MRRIRAILGIGSACAVLLAGCASRSGTAAASDNSSDFQSRAAAVIKVWTDAGMPVKWRTGFVPLQDLTVIGPDPGFGNAAKTAFMQGFYRIETGVRMPTPRPSEIRFPDGSSMKIAVQTASDAFAAIHHGECSATDSDCRTLTITNVTITQIKFLTSRGLASVPAWMFNVAGLKAPIFRVAVPPSHVTKVPSAPGGDWPHVDSLRAALNLIDTTGTEVGFHLGVGACDKNIKPRVYETDGAIAVGGTAVVPDTGQSCADILLGQPETVTLSAPVGSRAILDATTGIPLQLAVNQ